MIVTVKHYNEFNQRRYSQPWIAPVNTDGKIDFSGKVGGYTGAYGKGEEGDLFIANPIEGQVYAYGQKDNRGNNGGYEYGQYKNGKFEEIEKSNIIKVLNEQ